MRIARIAAATAALALSAQVSAAQQPGAPQPSDRRPGATTGMSGMADQMRAMDSLSARLDTLVSRMNRATGNRKVAAMADVINELVAQRKAMHERMREMMQSRQGMMMHMMREPVPPQGRPPTSETDSAADTAGHAEHHPPD